MSSVIGHLGDAFYITSPVTVWRLPEMLAANCRQHLPPQQTRSCSALGFEAGGFLRATGASTVTGGSGDCWAPAAPIEATATRQPTVILRVGWLPIASLIAFASMSAHRERGLITLLMKSPPRQQLLP
jgi:hypothetical protein